MFIFLEYEVFFGGSNDQFMGLILVSFLVQTLITHPVFNLFSKIGQNRLTIWSVSLCYSLYVVNLKQLGLQSSVIFFSK